MRKPSWIRSVIPVNEKYKQIKRELKAKGLFTVCEEANCPNLGECWQKRTATIMILGDVCTRGCRFCSVKTGNPKGFVDVKEIKNAVELVEMMQLKYIVITSVDRDDLNDFGAGHFAAVVREIKKQHLEVKVEVLIPDFNGDESSMHQLAQSGPFVIAHNIETVAELTDQVRDRRASYQGSLKVLRFYKENYPHISTKSSIMVGLGEDDQMIERTLYDLRENHVDIVTVGQYLRPSLQQLEVKKYYTPDEFEKWKEYAYQLGFKFVASGPMVRSSYRASDYLQFIEEQNAR